MTTNNPVLPGTEPSAVARLYLDDLMARVGVDGLAAALAEPSLLAQVDQHAAAVRQALRAAGRETDAMGLAGYARSVAASAQRMGRPVPEVGRAYVTGAQWQRAEWHLLRLLGVCLLAEARGLL